MQESNDDQEDTIDLTSDGHEQVMPRPHLALPRNPMAPLASGLSASSHAQRLPRFQRDIIDLADSDEDDHQPQQPQNFSQPEHMDNAQDEDSLFIPEAQPRRTTAGLRRPGFMRQLSPAMDLDDIEFVGSRPLSRAQSRRATPANGPNRTTTPNVEVNATIDLTADDDDDDVIHTNTRELPSINGDRPAMAGSGIGVRDQPAFNNMGLGRLVNRLREARPGFAGAIFGPYINGIGEDAEARAQHQRATRERANAARDNAQNIEAQLNRAQAQNVGLFGDGGRAAPPPRPRHLPTIRMDYNMVGFDLGFGIVPNRPPTPKYEPPPAVEKGFTRSPVEEEEVVCPNCGDELAVGKGETKQQIYVVKTCGHVSSPYPFYACKDVLRTNIANRLTAANVRLEKNRARKARAAPRTRICRRRSRNASLLVAARARARAR